ncbi:hypothetical protein L1049_019858 [Liquidambar formosana]|uniref:B3 domain-containing protein n=1 Tax=Liquidambar formosana TaxID=63359 RepID=A0AAP0X6V0_LIQFO
MVEIRADPPHLLEIFPWEIKKVLTNRDVGFFGGLELSQEQVYYHIFKYWDEKMASLVIHRGGHVPIVMRDLDTNTEHELFFKKWTSDENYVIHTYWKREFVARRGLKEGMLIGMYWNISSSCFCFSVLNNSHVSHR